MLGLLVSNEKLKAHFILLTALNFPFKDIHQKDKGHTLANSFAHPHS